MSCDSQRAEYGAPSALNTTGRCFQRLVQAAGLRICLGHKPTSVGRVSKNFNSQDNASQTASYIWTPATSVLVQAAGALLMPPTATKVLVGVLLGRVHDLVERLRNVESGELQQNVILSLLGRPDIHTPSDGFAVDMVSEIVV